MDDDTIVSVNRAAGPNDQPANKFVIPDDGRLPRFIPQSMPGEDPVLVVKRAFQQAKGNAKGHLISSEMVSRPAIP